MDLLSDLSVSVVVTRVVAYLIIVAIHGFTLTLIADRLGDRDPAYQGRLTLNPFVQFSGPGLIAALIFRIGWGRPLSVDPTKLRWGRPGLVAVALGALLVLLAIVWLLNWVRLLLAASLSGTAAQTALAVVQEIQQQGLWFVLLNLLPIPALTGGLFLQALVPATGSWPTRYGLLAMVIVFALLTLGLPQLLLGPLYGQLSAALVVLIS